MSQALNGRAVPSEATLVSLARALNIDPVPLLALRQRACPDSAKPGGGTSAKRDSAETAFEERYQGYVVERYAQLTIVGLDLRGPQAGCWPLDAAYLSLELAENTGRFGVNTAGGEELFELVNRTGVTKVERAERALGGRDRVMVRGLAGSGKTTLLQWLATGSARGELPAELDSWNGSVPFVLPLRTLIRRGGLPQPANALESVGCPLASAQPEGWADTVLSAGRGLVLVDGIDEVPQEQRENTRTWLRDLLAAYPDSRYVVTTRPSAVPEGWLGGAGFTELTVRPMSVRDVTVFIGRWHSAAKATVATEAERGHLAELEDSLRDAVRAERDLAQLSTTPLMCALICALHRDRRGHLPHSRMELYEAALSMLLARRDHERGIGAPEGIELTEHQSIQLLQRLAYWLIRNGQTEMEYQTAVALIDEALPAMRAVSAQGDGPEIVGHLVARCGLLRQPTADTVDFVHRTFQDYLGAKAAVEARDFGLLTRHAHEDQWEDVVKMAVAHARSTERATLLRRIIARGDRTAKHRIRLHLLATACLGNATELDPQVRDEVEKRTSALLPPRSPAEAGALAAVGPVILDLLPGPENLHDDEAAAVVHTAALIGGDAALMLLKKYRCHSSLSVQAALTIKWSAFDTAEYAREIIEFLPVDQILSVESPLQFEELKRMRRRPLIRCTGEMAGCELAAVLDAESLNFLHLYDMYHIGDLRFVRKFANLRTMVLMNCSFESLTPLRGLPLRGLTVWEEDGVPVHGFDVIASLSELRELNLDAPLPFASLGEFLADCKLERFYMWRGSAETTALDGIRGWRELEFLSIDAGVVSEPGRAELAALPRLRELQLFCQDIDLLGQQPVLPELDKLTLNVPLSADRLGPVAQIFPGLQELQIFCRPGSSVDLTGLSTMPDLKVRIVDAYHVHGVGHFPLGAVTRVPRLRT